MIPGLPLSVDDVLGPGGLFSRVLPGYESRPGQLDLGRGVEALLRESRPGVLLGDAPVGVGKGFSYLTPALLAGVQTVVATSTRVLQDQLALKDLPFLAETLGPARGRAVTWATVKGMQNYPCLRVVDELEREAQAGRAGFVSPEAARDFPRFLEWHGRTADGDLERVDGPPFDPGLVGQLTVGEHECLGSVCPFSGECWALSARERAKTADVTVTNHALLLLDAQLRYRTGGKASLLPAPGLVVVDEAHDLPPGARGTLGEQLSFSYGRTLARRLPRLPYGDLGHGMEALALDRALGTWETAIRERLAAPEPREEGGGRLLLGEERRWAAPVADAARELAETCRGLYEELKREAVASLRRGDEPPEPTMADAAVWERQGEALERFARVAMAVGTPLEAQPGADPDGFVRLAELEGTGRRQRLLARYLPVDVAPALKLYLWRSPPGVPPRPVVAVSATLATAARGAGRFAFFAQESGAPTGATAGPEDGPVYEVVVGSPFNFRRAARLYVPVRGRISADREREPEQYFRELAAELSSLLRASEGKAFCLFTSRRSMAAAYERVAPELPSHWRVFLQGRDSRQEVLRAFRDEAGAARNPPVLFGLKTYFEGVDVPGAGLSLVVLDRLPFAAPSDPLYAARARQLGRQAGDPVWGHWSRLTLPGMLLVVKQATGRLIRSQSDRGVAALLDRRVLEQHYGRRVVSALPPMPLIGSLEEVRRFLRGPP